MAKLTARGRKRISKSNFAIPGKRKYPIHDLVHARNALSRVAQHGTASEKKQVRAAVYRKYPQLKKRAAARKKPATKRRSVTRKKKTTRRRK